MKLLTHTELLIFSHFTNDLQGEIKAKEWWSLSDIAILNA